MYRPWSVRVYQYGVGGNLKSPDIQSAAVDAGAVWNGVYVQDSGKDGCKVQNESENGLLYRETKGLTVVWVRDIQIRSVFLQVGDWPSTITGGRLGH